MAQVMETQFLENQTAFEARRAAAAEEARMKEDSTAAEASLRRAERATEIERSASFAHTPPSSCKGSCMLCLPQYCAEWQLESLLLVKAEVRISIIQREVIRLLFEPTMPMSADQEGSRGLRSRSRQSSERRSSGPSANISAMSFRLSDSSRSDAEPSKCPFTSLYQSASKAAACSTLAHPVLQELHTNSPCYTQEESAAHCRARNVAHAAFLQHQIKAKQARREQSIC